MGHFHLWLDFDGILASLGATSFTTSMVVALPSASFHGLPSRDRRKEQTLRSGKLSQFPTEIIDNLLQS